MKKQLLFTSFIFSIGILSSFAKNTKVLSENFWSSTIDELCIAPSNLSASVATTTSVQLNWTKGNLTDASWEVLLIPVLSQTAPDLIPSENPILEGGAVLISITGSNAFSIISNLAAATNYVSYIRTVCSSNSKSAWSPAYVFNTLICNAAEKCSYRFLLTNTTNNGWNSGRMQVRQNGIIVYTLGTGSVNNPNGIALELCNNVPFDVYWNAVGTLPENIGLTVLNSFQDIIYTKLAGEGTPLTVLYANNTLGNCELPTCPKPTNLLVDAVSQTTATVSWTAGGSETQWEVYVVTQGGTPPINGMPLNGNLFPYFTANTNTNFQITGLISGTQYEYYVRAICSTTDNSTWTIINRKLFVTKPFNDECAEAISVPINATQVVAQTVSGSTLGGTASAEIANCPGFENDDVWYSFVATNNFHTLALNNIIGTTTSLRYAVYSGDDCATLTQIFCSVFNVNSTILENLVAGTTYKIRVYTNSGSLAAYASFTLALTTPTIITNDECATATPLVINSGLDCIEVVSGSITGATASSQASTCPNAVNDDVWFSFVAIDTKHLVTLQNIVGTSTLLNGSLYSGNDCGTLTFLYCLISNQSTLQGLIIGNTYKIRVWSSAVGFQNIQFDLCISRPPSPITVSTTQYTKPKLITDVLINSTCKTVSNISWSTGTTTATNGIGYFNRGQSNFPFEDGIVLVTGSAVSAVGPNNTVLSNGGNMFGGGGGDADLSAILAAQTPPQNGTLNNATKLEFDFVALTNQVNFNFMFASEEYGQFQCNYSDAFAFILTDVTAGTLPVNLAVIPGTTIPVSVVNIRNNQHNLACASVNEEYFATFYNNPAGVFGAPVNFNGVTVPMSASSTVTPGNTYHIKMVIADYTDNTYDSAVFLEGGSFDVGTIDLPEDYLITSGTALCAGDAITLNTQLNPDLYVIQWYNGPTLIPGATSPSFTVFQSGTYSITAVILGTECVSTESITVEYAAVVDAVVPADLVVLASAGEAIFDLTSTRSIILSPFAPNTHEVVYFLTEADAESNNTLAALTPAQAQAFVGTNGQEIFVRVNFLTTTCFQIVSFNLIVEELSTNSFDVNNLFIYPNPAKELVNIQLKNSTETLQKVIIYDLIGKAIKAISGNGGQQSSIDVGDLSKGVYIIEITTDTNLKQIRKFIVN
jgi:hypothetical protein